MNSNATIIALEVALVNYMPDLEASRELDLPELLAIGGGEHITNNL